MATITINELVVSAGTTQTFDSGNTYIISVYTNGDWNGTAGNLTKFRSGTPGTSTIIQIPGDISVSYLDLRDISFIGGTVYADNTCKGETANNNGVVWDSTRNIWSAAGATNWSNDASWSLGHKPTSDEIAVFNGTSLQAFTADIDVTCAAILIDASYSTNWSFSGRGLSLSSGFSSYGAGTGNLGNRLTITGDSASVFLDASVGVLTAQNCAIDWSGVDGYITNNIGRTFKTLSVASAKSLTVNGTAVTTLADYSTTLNLASGATLSMNQVVQFQPYASQTAFNIASDATLNGTANYYINGTTASLSIAIPAMTYLGSGTLIINPAATSTTTFNTSYTTSGSLNLTGGAVTISSVTFTFNGGNSVFTVGSGIGTFVSSTSNLIFNGTGSLVDNKSTVFRTLTLGAGAVFTLSGGGGTIFRHTTTPVTLNNNATFTGNALHYISCTGNNPLMSLPASYTYNGSGAVNFQAGVNSGITVTMPAFNYTGNGSVSFKNVSNSSWTITFTGNQNYGSSTLIFNPNDTNSVGIMNFGNYTYTCGQVTVANAAAMTTGSFTVNYGSATFNITSYTGNAGCQAAVNFGTSVWTCAGSWTFGSNHVVDIGTASITLTGSGTITTNGKTLYYLRVNAPGYTVTSADTLNIADGGSLIVSTVLGPTLTTSSQVWNFLGDYTFNGAGNLNIVSNTQSITITVPTTTYTGTGTLSINTSQTGDAVTFSGPVSWSGNVNLTNAPTLTISSSLTMTGNSTTLTIAATLGTVAVSSCDLIMNGTGMSIVDNKGVAFKTLTLGPSAYVSISGGGSLVFQTSSGTPLTLGSSSTLNNTVSTYFSKVNSSGNMYSLGSGYSITGSGTLLFRPTSSTVTLPAITATNPIGIYATISTGASATLTGDVTCGNFAVWSNNNTTEMTFNTGNFNLTCGVLTLGMAVTPTTGYFIFNAGSSTINCTSLSASYNNLSTINWQTSQITCSGNFVTGGYHQVSCNAGCTLTMTGASANLTFSALTGSGSISLADMPLTMNGTTAMTLTDNAGVTLKTLTLGPNAKVTSNGSAESIFISNTTPLIMGSSSTLTCNRRVNFDSSDSITAYSLGSGYTINGTNSIYFRAAASGITLTCPAITTGGTSQLVYSPYAAANNCTINITGTVSTPSLYLIGSGGATGNIINTNNNSITASTSINTGTSNGSLTLNFGSSNVSVGSYSSSGFTGGTTYINLSTSVWTCSGSWAFGSTHIIDPGTSQITFNGTGASAVTSGNQSFYDVIVNNSSKAFSFVGNASVHNLTTTAMTSYTNTGAMVAASNNITFNGTGTLNLGNGLTLNGSTSTLSINSTVGAITSNNAVLTANGTNCTVTDNEGVFWKQITVGNGAKLTASGSPFIVIQGSVTALNIGNNGTFTNNVQMLIYPSSTMQLLTFGTDATWNGASLVSVRAGGNLTLTIPAFTYSGAGTFTINDNANVTATTNFAGPASLSNLTLNMVSGSSQLTVNTNDNPLNITNALTIGTNSTTNPFTVNFGNSPINVGSFVGSTYNGSGTKLNMQGSQWTCRGNWTNGSAHTVSHWWDTVTMAPATSDATIISAGKAFNNLIINSPGKTVYLSDPTVFRGFQTIDGTFNKGNKVTVNKDLVVITDILSY